MKYVKHTAVSLAVIMFLAACGGGGNGSISDTPVTTTPSTPVQPANPPVTPVDRQISVPALTYAIGSQEFAFVTALNEFRQELGLGLIAQNSYLDKSAQNHLQYIVTNNLNYGGTVDMSGIDRATGYPMYHVEQAGKLGFTGVSPSDRNKFAGYDASGGGEQVSFAGGYGAQIGLSDLVGTVYHRAGLMFQDSQDVGVAVGSDRSQTIVLEYSYKTAQANASDYFGVYPSDKQTGVGLYTTVEAPNPFPDLSTSNSDYPMKTGYPISVMSKEGTTLEVVNWTVTEAGSAVNLSARLKTASNDANRLVPSNMAFLIANERLKPNTTYNIVFFGRVNNVAVTKAWSFTTGN